MTKFLNKAVFVGLISGVLYSVADIVLRASCMGSTYNNNVCNYFSRRAGTYISKDIILLDLDYAFYLFLFLIFINIIFEYKKGQKRNFKVYFFSFFIMCIAIFTFDNLNSYLWLNTEPLSNWKVDCKNKLISTPIYNRNFKNEEVRACNFLGKQLDNESMDIFGKTIKN